MATVPVRNANGSRLMRRPWTEAVALLAAHNLPTPAPRNLHRRRFRMSHDVRFAILTANPADNPKAFPDLEAMACYIQRECCLQASNWSRSKISRSRTPPSRPATGGSKLGLRQSPEDGARCRRPRAARRR